MATTTNFGWNTPDDTDLVKDGALAIRTLGSDIDTALVDLKGGDTGQSLVKASGSDLDYAWASNFSAGKNKIINGDFSIWQRGTTFTDPSGGAYLSDRIRYSTSTALPTSISISQQTFTPGTAPVAGYEAQYFFRSVLTTVGSATQIIFSSMVEDVRTLAGQTVTFSFWAKSDSNRTQPAPTIEQQFGSGGSTAVNTTLTGFDTTTSWQRFSFTLTMPSVSGKTIGTGSHLRVRILQNLTNGNTLDIWGLQLEAGSVATAFQTATGTLQGELAACQRYYWRTSNPSAFALHGTGLARSTTEGQFLVTYPVAMRVAPTSLDFSNLEVTNAVALSSAITGASISQASSYTASVYTSGSSGLTADRVYFLANNNSTSGYIGFSAEL